MTDPVSIILNPVPYDHAEYDSTVSFNSGHTCSKMQEPKRSKENSVSSDLH